MGVWERGGGHGAGADQCARASACDSGGGGTLESFHLGRGGEVVCILEVLLHYQVHLRVVVVFARGGVHGRCKEQPLVVSSR